MGVVLAEAGLLDEWHSHWSRGEHLQLCVTPTADSCLRRAALQHFLPSLSEDPVLYSSTGPGSQP